MSRILVDLEPELRKIAKEQLNEDPEGCQNDLASIKDWISKQPHLCANMSDEFLISFLRNAKYRLENAKLKLDFYYTFRAMSPDFYLNRVPIQPNVEKLIKSGAHLVLPGVHPADLGIITLTTLGVLHQTDCSMSDLLRLITMHNDRFLIYDKNATIAGQHSIIDFKGTTMITATQSTALAKKIVAGIQNVYPIRIIKFHLVNLKEAPVVFEPVIKLIKSMLKSKIATRIMIHDNLDSLLKEVPKSILPSNLNGDAGSIELIMKKNWMDIYYKDTEWFTKDEFYKTDESKRIGGPAITNEMFGTDGSFRKMDID